MYTFPVRTQIVVVTHRHEVIRFCQHTLEPDFRVLIVSNSTECAEVLSFFTAILIVDCNSCDYDIMHADKRGIPAFNGTIIFLTHNSYTEQRTPHRLPRTISIPFPCDIDLFRHIIERTVSTTQHPVQLPIAENKRRYYKSISGFEEFIGTSEAMYTMKNMLTVAAAQDMTILLLGESGTGKSVAARMIHENSRRKEKKFLRINMATVPEHFAESQLFGTERGAYTDAVKRAGFFVEADGGTIFMDEIAEMSLRLQAKLLTVLDTKSFYSVGSDKEKKSDVRIICASNANLPEYIKAGKFRKDLYYRIATFPVRLPPLRHHREDIKAIVYSLLETNKKQISAEALKKLEAYNWPGNVRELKNCIERSCALCPDPMILPEHIFIEEEIV